MSVDRSDSSSRAGLCCSLQYGRILSGERSLRSDRIHKKRTTVRKYKSNCRTKLSASCFSLKTIGVHHREQSCLRKGCMSSKLLRTRTEMNRSGPLGYATKNERRVEERKTWTELRQYTAFGFSVLYITRAIFYRLRGITSKQPSKSKHGKH